MARRKRRRNPQLKLDIGPKLELAPPAPLPDVRYLPSEACCRCEERVPLHRRCALGIEWIVARGEDLPQRSIGAVILCDSCAMTILHCLERGTRMTPIVPSPSHGVYVEAAAVVCVRCREHPPCACGLAA